MDSRLSVVCCWTRSERTAQSLTERLCWYRDPVPRGTLDREKLRANAPSAAVLGLIPTEEDGEAFGSKKGIGKMESAGDEASMMASSRR